MDDYYGHKTGLLRDLVLGNDAAARAHLEALPRRYMADPPPDRLELADGILNGDEAMLREGIRKIGTRFAANWNPRKHEEWARKHHKQLSVVMDASRGALIALHWVLSEWGVACASLAVHRGLTGLLGDAALWSEWLPRSLCADRPLLDDEPKSRPRAAAKPQSARPPSPSAKPVPGPGPTPLHEAVEEEDHEKLATLIAAGADLEARDHKALTPLLRAVRDDNLTAVHLLLQAGAAPNAVDDLLRGALHFLAVRGASVDVARELLARGADVDLRLDDGTRPLQIVSTPQMAEVLLDAGAEIDARNDHGTTALCRMIRDGKSDLALLLIARGADPGITRNDGHTPLHEACKKTSSEVVAALLDHGAEVNGMTPYGIGPLHLAAGMRQREIVKLLLQRGADVNLRQPGMPEDFAAYVDDMDLTLVYTGGDQRKRQYNLAPGSTPLHFAAVARSNADVVQLLLDNGADPSIRDCSGRTALDWARECEDSRTVKLLERHD